MNSLFVGNFKSAFHGRGIEFQDFREYTPLDDAKYIDWVVSGREGKTIMRRYREDKEGTVLCVLDEGESLKYRSWIKYKLAQEILLLLGQASLQSGDKFWGYRIIDSGAEYIAPKKSQVSLESFISEKNLHKDQDIISLDFLMKNPLKKSIVFIISDSLDIDEKSFKIASLKHDVIYLHISDYFENTLEGRWVDTLRGASWSIAVNLGNTKKKQIYQKKRQEQLQSFSRQLRKLWIASAFFDETESVFSQLLKLMKQREQ